MVSCILMASGYSRRLGKNKLLLKYDGKTLIERTVERLKATSIDEVIVVYKDDEVLKLIEKYDVKAVFNTDSDCGQSESIKIGIENSNADTDGYMFAVGDQPFMKSDTVENLIELFKRDKTKIVLPRSMEKKGNPVIFSTAYREELLSLSGDTGGKAVIENHRKELIFLEVESMELFDIDTEKDLEVLK